MKRADAGRETGRHCPKRKSNRLLELSINQMGKVKRTGRTVGRRDHVKKAYVCLKPGQELNFSGEAA